MPTDGNNINQAENNDQNQKVTFTPEQQARIDEIIRESMGRAGREARQHAAQLQTEMTRLEKELAEARAGQPDLNEIRQQLAARDAEVQKTKDELQKTRKETLLRAAVAKHNFVDPAMALKLAEESFRLEEDGKLTVVNEHGTRLNNRLEPMTAEQFFSEFAANNPFLVRGDVRGGVGSTESSRSGLGRDDRQLASQIFGKNSDSVLANKLAKTNPAEYKRLKQVARENRLISW